MLLYSVLLCFLVESFANLSITSFKHGSVDLVSDLQPWGFDTTPSVRILTKRFFPARLCDGISLGLATALDSLSCSPRAAGCCGVVCLLKNSLLRNAKRNQLLELIYTFVNFGSATYRVDLHNIAFCFVELTSFLFVPFNSHPA